MAETLTIPNTSDRAAVYAAIYPQIEAILSGESDPIANMANLVAVLREAFSFFWIGFYRVQSGELVLGPFQGPIACTRIAFNRGVCGHCYQTQQTVIVPNVDEFPGHIACSSAAKSEIVVPVCNAKNEIIAVLDVDSDRLSHFSILDQEWLERIVALLAKD